MSTARRVRLPGGLGATECAPASGEQGRPPVLLVHGMAGGAWQFEWFQRSLSAAGYRSLALDYRGHHGSRPVARLGRVGVHEYLDDALVACRYLGGRPLVVGQSMGGLIAQLLGARDAVGAAVLMVSLPPRGVRWRSVKDPRLATRHLPALLGGRPLMPSRAEAEELILNRIPLHQRREFFARQAPESSRAGAEIAFGRVVVDPGAIACPVLSVTASEDRLVLPQVGIELARRYGGDHLELDDHGHYALVGEPGWEAVAARVIGWLDEPGSRGTSRRRRS
jgi:pimeloyl-ACP methyl ester carboxylesterase